ncbi:hypothetical protein CLAIMM_11362 [Cladophialophora immunda]|nr:hypothetical protein CLAIMM_11362 [Cladophialophora immunda]
MDGWNRSSTFDDTLWENVSVSRLQSSVELISPDAPPVRVTESLRPMSIFQTPPGRTIVDFGQNLHAEVLENGELGRRPLREAQSYDRVTLAGRELQRWSPRFTFHGFRYVQIDRWSTTDEIPLNRDSILAEVMHTDLQRTGAFSCSQPLVNKLHECAVWSMRGNFLSIPTDCPQRDERLRWTGDVQVFSPSVTFLYDVSAILGGWLQDLAAEQGEPGRHGIPPLAVPNVIERDHPEDSPWWPLYPQAVWNDATVIVPWHLYQASGDSNIPGRQLPSMQAWIDRGVRRGDGGLWDENLWQLGDWLVLSAPPDDPGSGRTDGTFVADSYLVHVTGLMHKIAAILGSDEADRYQREFEQLKSRYQRKCVTPDGLVVCDTNSVVPYNHV